MVMALLAGGFTTVPKARAAQALSGLPVGSLIKFGTYKVEGSTTLPIIWKVIDKNHTGYPTNSVTLLTEKIIDLRGFDAKETGNANAKRVDCGNNRYLSSNLRQWLNSSGAASAWWTAQNPGDGVSGTNNADATPADAGMTYSTGYYDIQGFLSNFSPAELANILDTTLTVARNTVTDTGATSETVVDKIFLLSNTEVGLANENGIAEGTLFSLFSSNAARIATATPQCIANTLSPSPSASGAAWYWWLRTPIAGLSHSTCGVEIDGKFYNSAANGGFCGVRPALNLASGLLVSDSTDVDGCYTVAAAGTDDTLSALTSSVGTPSPTFAAGTTTYSVVLPYGTITIPTVTATTNDSNATAVVTPAASVTGSATVLVTAQDTTTKQTYTINFTVAAYVAVTGITGVATTGTVGTALALSGTVAPTGATNKTIAWTVKSGTATVTGNQLTATAAGDVVVEATITNGSTASTAYVWDFTITFSAAYVAPNEDQSAPTGLAGVVPTSALTDGKITGTTTAMQYKLASADDTTYATCTVDQAGLSAGSYVVRYAAKTGFNAGATAAVTVPVYVAPTTTYTVTFDSQGGSTVAAITGITSGATVTLPTAPTKAGSTFANWNTAAAGTGTAFTATTAVIADVTVYAQWTVTYIPAPAPVPTPSPSPAPVPAPAPLPSPSWIRGLILQIGKPVLWNNSIPTKLDSAPVIKNSRTRLPIRAIIEALGGTVTWDPIAHKVTVTLGTRTVVLWIGKSLATVNGVPTPIDATDASVVPAIINGRTMLSLRFISENLGATVGWAAATQTITIPYTP
jgi:uncharacterized repeat protein (TIGR02543 family)